MGTILLATDLSCRCDRALDRAVMLAAERRARLVVLHVVQQPGPFAGLPSWRRPADPLQAARERVYRDLQQSAPDIEIDVMVERGDPATLVPDVVERLGGELAVTGVARDETLGRHLLGSTVEALVRKAKVPVLVVKSRPRAPYRNVVVATDFSESSRCALEAAIALLPAAHVSLFHAFDVSFESRFDDKPAARESAMRRRIEESQAFLAATPVVAVSGHPVTTFCEYGEVGELLQDLVQAREVDLVALGTEGRSALTHALLGSVAQHLLGFLSTDVLMVRRRQT